MSTRLAINGGEKTVNINRSHFVWPPISEKTRAVVERQLGAGISIYNKSGIIAELEDQFADYHNRKHALLTSSGTAALHSVFVGANFSPGDEVLCPAYTFYATITPIFFTGAIPVLVDCREDGNLDPDAIEAKITERTKAIVVTHMWGLPCEMDAISAIAARHNLQLFEDVSHAHGATYNDQLVGTFGDASAFSLQGQKTVTGGEGGILLTDNDEIFYRALLLGHYNKRCKTEIPSAHPLARYATTGMGLKLRIHPVAAAIAKQQFAGLPQILAGRQKMAQKMVTALADLPGIRVPVTPNQATHTWYAFVMQYQAEELGGLPIERFYDALQAEGCKELDRPGSTCPLNYHPLFQDPGQLFPGYNGQLNYRAGDFPVAENFHSRCLKLPVWHDPKDEEIVDLYIQAFRKVVANHHALL
ncbi:MAG: DegT/DnrJ/EryC1/StrS family aminotransferase [Anaerolineales bacterium]|nr:DegT/DnrJ/EryC1/StrS family aminotransferase [Anaerolineales bacterium]MCB8953237.1 DegT/DnrJ/EryC1/StrS family aminotransferase [Ardenticatenales bacterium]